MTVEGINPVESYLLESSSILAKPIDDLGLVWLKLHETAHADDVGNEQQDTTTKQPSATGTVAAVELNDAEYDAYDRGNE